MGEVYRAHDTRLDRDVALKVLPEDVATDPKRRERFEREAKALARLSHPNIPEIHDIGTEGEITYAVMELLKGETLRGRVERSSIPWQEALDISGEVAQGLAAAHEQGIVHRDLKPDNIFIEATGRTRILDFGIARVDKEPREAAGTRIPTAPLTEPGIVMGTVGYMSPEQISGQEVDRRTDFFSLGCVLYEMVSGRGAFVRNTAPETLKAILTEDPPDLASTGAKVPPQVEKIVGRCLEKQAEFRYQTADDLMADIRLVPTDARPAKHVVSRKVRRRVAFGALPAALAIVAAVVAMWWFPIRSVETTPAPAPDSNTVLVAAFENRTGDPLLDSVGPMAADWVTQGLLDAGQVQVVLTPTMVLAAGAGGNVTDDEEKASTVRALAASTGAGIVVSGAYYLQGESLQFQAKITDVAKDRIVQAIDPVSGPRDNVMEVIGALREQVLGAVVWSFHEGLGIDHYSKPPRYEAYREYIMALELYGPDFQQSIKHLVRASELDPDFMVPRLWLAEAYFSVGRVLGNPKGFVRHEAVLRELEANPERLTPLGRLLVRWHRLRLEGRNLEGLRVLREAEKLAPQDAIINFMVANQARTVHRQQEAVDTLAKMDAEFFYAYDIGLGRFNRMARAHHELGNHEDELRVGRRSREYYPHITRMFRPEIRALAAMGRIEELDRTIDESLSIPAKILTSENLILEAADELRAHGYPEESIRSAERLLAILTDEPPEPRPAGGYRFSIVRCYELLGRWDEAYALMKELVEDHPDNVEYRGRLGSMAARLGRHDQAREAARWLEDLDRPYLFGTDKFYRAKIAAQLEEPMEAVYLLREAFAEGYGFPIWLHRQMDFESLRDFPPYQEFVRPKA
jgi:tetratricopeptide (TPR) repeat protein/predicted Ser/Thr protein kinase